MSNPHLGREGVFSAKEPNDKRRKTKVLYIAGWGRSGSTILGRVLGQLRDFFMVGELRYVWDRGLLENRLCSCGAPFIECPVWGAIMLRVGGVQGRLDASRLIDLRQRGLRTRHVLFTPTQDSLRQRVAKMGEYTDAVERLYQAVGDVSGSNVIVDTSKFPSYAYILGNVPGIDLYLVHLVRDPRAVAYSWASRRKPQMDGKRGASDLMTAHGLLESSLVWNEWNLAIKRTWKHEPKRYMLLRYEDFVENPRDRVADILRFVGEERENAPFINKREILLEPSHTFAGNPDRFRSGTVKIEPDEEWNSKMSAGRRAAITALTWPGLLSYEYPLWR